MPLLYDREHVEEHLPLGKVKSDPYRNPIHSRNPLSLSEATFSSQENFEEKIMNGSVRIARFSESARMKASKKAFAKLPSILALIRIRAVAIIEFSSSFISRNLSLSRNVSLGISDGEHSLSI
jgi:hypothetical protein